MFFRHEQDEVCCISSFLIFFKSLKNAVTQQQISAQLSPEWVAWSIDTLLLKINEERNAVNIPTFPNSVIAQAQEKLIAAPSAGDLVNYTLDELKAKGIESSVATAIVKFIEHKQPHKVATPVYVIFLPFIIC